MPDSAPQHPLPRFPTYGDWLTSHDDATLVDLLWRLRAFHGPVRPGAPTRSVADAITDVIAVRQLNASALAVLHSLVHAGAADGPVGADDLNRSLTELCDRTGTPEDRRPTAADLPHVLGTLAHRGLAYGPGLRIDDRTPENPFPVAVPDHLRSVFSTTTDHPWALVDSYRCPVPTTALPGVLDGLPDRQRRLLDTLATAGGIGHSTSLDDPDRPLARMIAAGLLDRLDAETARLSPRVGAVIAERIVPDPGGDFTVPAPVPATDRIDGAGVARVVETLRQITDLLTELGTAPLRPLGGGGVGVREISRLARRTGTGVDETTATLLLCRHADFIAAGVPVPAPETDTAGPDGEVWGVTDRGAEFLAADTAGRWARLLAGWSDSPHSPWEADGSGAHLLEDRLDHPHSAALRHATAELAVVTDQDDAAPVQLWRLRPALAARTDVAALAGVLAEADLLGLRSAGSPTSAATALATALATSSAAGPTTGPDISGLSTALGGILPPPVRMLIVQADLTVLAPGLLDGPTESMLRAIADVESTGMASVWRISPTSLKRAAAAGETAERVRAFLAGMAPEIPQGLDYLITDTFRASNALTAGTAATVITAPDETTLSTALASLSDGEAADAGLRRIAPTVAVSRVQLSAVVDILEDAGLRVSVDGDSTATAHGPLLSLVPDPQHPQVTRDDVEDQLAATVEGFRRARQSVRGGGDNGDDVGDLPEVDTVRDPRAIMTALHTAYDRGTPAEISYVTADGTPVQEWISVVTMSPVSIVGVTESDGTSLRIQPHRIAWVATPR